MAVTHSGTPFDGRAALPVERFVRRLEAAEQLDGPARKVAQSVAEAVQRDGRIKSALSGTWLGHPLHALLTDVPIGAFTSASLLDLLPTRWAQQAADALVTLGLVSALPTAAAGLSDWSDTLGAARRVGFVHAVANTVALGLYWRSGRLRRRGQRARGGAYALAGLSVLGVGGHLGGHLSYRLGIGVNENAFSHPPSEWEQAIGDEQLPERQLTRVTVEGMDVLLYRADGHVYALANRCSHEGGPLDQGELFADRLTVMCPWHRSEFSLADGVVTRGPATAPQPAFETRVRDGRVEVRVVSP